MNHLFMEYSLEEYSILNRTKEDEIFQEGAVYNILDDILAFFQRIINDLVCFGKKVKNDVDSLIKKREVRLKLKKLKEELKTKENEGIKKVSMIDVESFVNYYTSYERKIMKKLETLSRGNFKKRTKFEKVADDIETDLEDMSDALQECVDNRIKVNIDEAIRYVEDNLNGQNEVEKKFVEVTHKLKDVSLTVERVIKNSSNKEDESYKRAYVGRLKRITRKISSTIGKWWSKFVMCVVFFFA